MLWLCSYSQVENNFVIILQTLEHLNRSLELLGNVWFVSAGGDLVVRPKMHTRDSSRAMLTLTEEEASRRSGGSPALSPCHSLPSGRPRRRESEPIGPQRPVRDPANQSEQSLARCWHVSGQTSEVGVEERFGFSSVLKTICTAAPPRVRPLTCSWKHDSSLRLFFRLFVFRDSFYVTNCLSSSGSLGDDGALSNNFYQDFLALVTNDIIIKGLKAGNNMNTFTQLAWCI